MGREFSFALIKAVAELPEPELLTQLSALKDAELLYERGIYPQTTYLFKHAFTRDVAYDSLLVAARRRLHQQIGEALLSQQGDNLEEWAGLLAHHFARSDDATRALPYLIQTGERAQRVYANAEAVRHFAQAMDILDTLPPTETTRHQRTDVVLRVASLHVLMGHYSESLALYARALDDAEATGGTKATAQLETRAGRVRYSTGDYEGAMVCFQRALDLAQRINDTSRMAVCYQSLGDVYFSSGSLPKAIERYMSALNISEEVGNQVGMAAACTFLCNAHARAGNLEEAVEWGHRALALGERQDDDRRVAWACSMITRVCGESGELTEAYALMDRTLQLFEKVGDFRGRAHAYRHHAFLAGLERDLERSLENSHRIIEMGKESGGFRHEVCFAFARAAEALLRLGRHREAFEYCHQGLALSLKTSNKLEYGYVYMVLAEVHASQEYQDWEKANWYLEESLKAFREVGAQIDVGWAHLAGARIAVLRQDGSARQWAETARGIFAERGAKALLQEAEELLATLE